MGTTATTSRVNQRYLAELAGVSRTTVTRALASDPRISDEVVRRVRRLAREHGYRVNAAARSIATQRNNCIGAVLCDRSMAHSRYGQLLDGVERATRASGMRLQVSVCQTAHLRDDELPPIFEEVGVDGVILMGDVSTWLLDRLKRWVMPAVLLGTQPQVSDFNQITGDPRLAASIMTRHLQALGHRRIGMVVGPLARPMHRTYADGFHDAQRELGVATAQIERDIQEVPSLDVIPAMQALLQRSPDLTAVFCDTDSAAWQVIQYLCAIGRQVPQDISVAGAGGGQDEHWGIALTCVNVNLHEMARSAVSLLIESTRSSHAVAKRIVVQPRVDAGQTAAAPPSPSSHLCVS